MRCRKVIFGEICLQRWTVISSLGNTNKDEFLEIDQKMTLNAGKQDFISGFEKQIAIRLRANNKDHILISINTANPMKQGCSLQTLRLPNKIIKIINIMNSKMRDLEESGISKYAMTERKSSRNPIPESLLDRDYQLERQYLEKLKVQRIKTEKLFEEYANANRELKKEREATARLRTELEELRARLGELQSSRTEVERNRVQLRTLQSENEQQKVEIRSLLADKSTLIKKFKEVEGQLSALQSLRLQQEEYRMQVQELEDEVADARRELKLAAEEHQQEMDSLRERHLELQRSFLEAGRELKKEKELRQTQRTRSEQDKDRWQQMMLEKTSAFEKLIANFEEELQIKDETFAKTVGELQKESKHWLGKFEEKSRETQALKKASDDHRESVRRGREQLEAVRTRLLEKERKYESLQKDLTECYASIHTKEEELVRIQKSLQSTAAAGERHSGRIRQLQEENAQLRQWMDEYEGMLQQRQRRELEHKELLEDELEEISKFEKIFKRIE